LPAPPCPFNDATNAANASCVIAVFFPQPLWMFRRPACGKVSQPTDGVALRTRCERFGQSARRGAGEKSVASTLQVCIAIRHGDAAKARTCKVVADLEMRAKLSQHVHASTRSDT
jgi:hypothetical protein